MGSVSANNFQASTVKLFYSLTFYFNIGLSKYTYNSTMVMPVFVYQAQSLFSLKGREAEKE